ncbi:hydroxymethylglutaryl-CoA lyase [Asticcacaulis sp. DW145]|uniref:hydroxymethylglutaryl-CoA lyase n=1 Tax=Asticcacaulis sp. DW145 TaxID=3095608 RepID=UPI003090F1F7|nr:hydroxymethylglutaryl-CoA lyase [Asticcacaulis sp. DW145]
MSRPTHVTLYEVGPRDGLQAEAQIVPTATKIALIDHLSQTGLRFIEATSFVSPRWVPQMGDAGDVMAAITRAPHITYPVLTPNLKGYEAALAAGAQSVAIFAAASETFSQKNINASIHESLERFAAVAQRARDDGIALRGYVSCALACPYEGRVVPEAVSEVTLRLMEMGCYEVSLGDTIGRGTPGDTQRLLDVVLKRTDAQTLAVHFHDTWGQALANILVSLDYGIRTVDASVGGLGGCPYAPGASGNVATEDVIYMLNGMGIETGVDLDKVIDAAWSISDALGRPPRSKAAIARGR